MRTKPLREVISMPLDRGFRAYKHGYPSDVTVWHYHPECELHAISRSSGLCYVGAYSGPFVPGNLILAGPHLPHMWVTDYSGYDEGTQFGDFIPDRDLVLQFSAEFAEHCVAMFSDCVALGDLMRLAVGGVQFSDDTSQRVLPLMDRLTVQNGPGRLALFFEIIDHLVADTGKMPLSVEWRNIGCQNPKRLDGILHRIADLHCEQDLSCSELAQMENMELSNFSRFFERHMNCSCIEYINRLRISKACQILIETDIRISSVAFEVGYGTLSTFNRNFQRFTGLSPTDFRAQWRHGETVTRIVRAHRWEESQNAHRQ